MGAESQIDLAIDVFGIRDTPDVLPDDLNLLLGELLTGSTGSAAYKKIVRQIHLVRCVPPRNGVSIQQRAQGFHIFPGALAARAVIDALLKVVYADLVELYGPDRPEVFVRRFVAIQCAFPSALPLMRREPQGEQLRKSRTCCGAMLRIQLWEVLHGGLFRGKAALCDPDRLHSSVVQRLVTDDLHGHPAAVLALVDAAGAIPTAWAFALGHDLLFPALGAEKGALGDLPLTFHANQEKHLPSPCKMDRKVVQ